jgi:hypothetical protein
MTTEDKEDNGKIIPLFGKDEMNLIEFPFGPIRSSKKIKTFEVEHQAFDRVLKREVTRQLIMTGSDKSSSVAINSAGPSIGRRMAARTSESSCRLIGLPAQLSNSRTPGGTTAKRRISPKRFT